MENTITTAVTNEIESLTKEILSLQSSLSMGAITTISDIQMAAQKLTILNAKLEVLMKVSLSA